MRNRILFVILFINFSLVFSSKLKKFIIEPTKEVSDKESEVWCKFQPNGYDCEETGRYIQDYYYDTKLEDCTLFSFGTCKHEQNKFNSLKHCRENCLAPGVREVYGRVPANIYCKFQPDFGLCHEYHPKFYYDMSTRTCRGFSYSGCGGNLNRFSTSQLCSTVCAGILGDISKELM